MTFQISIAGWRDLICELRKLNDTLSKLSVEPDFTSEDQQVKATTQQANEAAQAVKDAQGRLPSTETTN